MTRLDDDVQQPMLRDLEEAAKRAAPQALPLGYASKLQTQPAPIDYPGTIRQLVFAAGLGFIAGGLVSWFDNMDAWNDGEVLWIAIGAAMVAATLPWPGRVGRRRT